MSQQQPRRPQGNEQQQEPVFPVSCELASKPIAQGTTGKVAYGGDGAAGNDIDIDIGEKITIGEALEATALSAGDKPVDQSDAAAIEAAEVRATGRNVITPGGVAAAAQAATTHNACVMRDEDKTTLGDILTDAALMLPADKEATCRDAEWVVGAEMRNNPCLVTHPGGVAASVVAASRLNQNND